MYAPRTYSHTHHRLEPRRRHHWLWTSLLVGCLLPIVVTSSLTQARLDSLTAELVRIAFLVPESIRAVSRRKVRVPQRRGVSLRALFLSPFSIRLPDVPFLEMVCGQDVCSRRGPPALTC